MKKRRPMKKKKCSPEPCWPKALSTARAMSRGTMENDPLSSERLQLSATCVLEWLQHPPSSGTPPVEELKALPVEKQELAYLLIGSELNLALPPVTPERLSPFSRLGDRLSFGDTLMLRFLMLGLPRPPAGVHAERLLRGFSREDLLQVREGILRESAACTKSLGYLGDYQEEEAIKDMMLKQVDEVLAEKLLQ